MKQDLHPEYHPVIFQDMTTGKQFITRSTAKSAKTETIDGVEHYVTEGRIDKFQKRFGAVRRSKKPKLG